MQLSIIVSSVVATVSGLRSLPCVDAHGACLTPGGNDGTYIPWKNGDDQVPGCRDTTLSCFMKRNTCEPNGICKEGGRTGHDSSKFIDGVCSFSNQQCYEKTLPLRD